MRDHLRCPRLVLCLSVAAWLAGPPAARAQNPTPQREHAEEPTRLDEGTGVRSPPEPRPSLMRPFVDAIGDLRRLPSWNSATWVGAGLGFAALAHPADRMLLREFAGARTRTFKAGAIVGGTPLELGASFATYAIGRSLNKPRAMRLGGDLIRAQSMAQLVTLGLKQAVRRSRPDGGTFSFPSGHTAMTFASASVLHQHFGWKTGVPAYAVASYVAASRVQTKRHYLSDVAFGAAIGLMAGRTVTLAGQTLTVMPLATRHGGGIGFSWTGAR